MILMKTGKNPSLALSKERVVSISLQAQGTEGESPKGNCHGGEREPQLGGGEWRRGEERGRENSGEWRENSGEWREWNVVGETRESRGSNSGGFFFNL